MTLTPEFDATFPATGLTPRTTEHPRRRELTEELCAALVDASDASSRDRLRERLVRLNMPVAETIAGRYSRRGIAAEDICQVAYLALVRAALRFDPGRGTPFLPYAVPTIRGEIRRYFRDLGWTVRPPRALQERQLASYAARSRLRLSLGRDPEVAEIAAELDEDPNDVHQALAARGCFTPDSLDSPVTGDSSTTVGDLLGEADPALSAAEARTTLAPALRTLGSRDRTVLQLRFVDDLTQREIAEQLDLTQVQVSRLIARILRDLRNALAEPECFPSSPVTGRPPASPPVRDGAER